MSIADDASAAPACFKTAVVYAILNDRFCSCLGKTENTAATRRRCRDSAVIHTIRNGNCSLLDVSYDTAESPGSVKITVVYTIGNGLDRLTDDASYLTARGNGSVVIALGNISRILCGTCNTADNVIGSGYATVVYASADNMSAGACNTADDPACTCYAAVIYAVDNAGCLILRVAHDTAYSIGTLNCNVACKILKNTATGNVAYDTSDRAGAVDLTVNREVFKISCLNRTEERGAGVKSSDRAVITVEEAKEALSACPSGESADKEVVSAKVDRLSHLEVFAGEVGSCGSSGIYDSCDIRQIRTALNQEGIGLSTGSRERRAYGFTVPNGDRRIVNRLHEVVVIHAKDNAVVFRNKSAECGSFYSAKAVGINLVIDPSKLGAILSEKDRRCVKTYRSLGDDAIAFIELDKELRTVFLDADLVDSAVCCSEYKLGYTAYSAFICGGINSVEAIPTKVHTKITAFAHQNVVESKEICGVSEVTVVLSPEDLSVEEACSGGGGLVINSAVVIFLNDLLKLKSYRIVCCRCDSLIATLTAVLHKSVLGKSAAVEAVSLLAVNVSAITSHIMKVLVIGALEIVGGIIK